MSDFAPEICHAHGLAKAPRLLKFDVDSYPREWISAARRTFKQLLGMMPGPCDPAPRIVTEVLRTLPGGIKYRELEFVFTAEPGADVPCWLLLPEGAANMPLVICLQGHNTGAHISLGLSHYPGDQKNFVDTPDSGDGDFALQALRQGFAALVIEQRAFGQRGDRRRTDPRHFNQCHHAAMTALLLGRSLAGERILDVSRAIDATLALDAAGTLAPTAPSATVTPTAPSATVTPTAPSAPAIDPARIGILGHSGGGLIAYYAAAVEPRLAAVMPACALCTYAASLAAIEHCADNYLPGILHYFEMADLAGLIAPRPLIVISGRTDPLFPHPGVETFMTDAAAIYEWLEAKDKLRWVVGEGGHRFYAKQGWAAFHEVTGW